MASKTYTVKAPNETYSGTRMGARFKEGKATGVDAATARALKALGYESDVPSGSDSDEPAEDKPLSRMTTSELEALAKAEEIDLSEAKTNPERVTAIEAAREKAADK